MLAIERERGGRKGEGGERKKTEWRKNMSSSLTRHHNTVKII
jgi:hypothetical protein